MTSLSNRLFLYMIPDWVEAISVAIIALLIFGVLVWKSYNFCHGLFAGSRDNVGFVHLNPQKTQVTPPYQRY